MTERSMWRLAATTILTLLCLPALLAIRHRWELASYRAELEATGRLKPLSELWPRPASAPSNGAAALLARVKVLPEPPFSLLFERLDGLPPGTRRVTWDYAEVPTTFSTNLWPCLRETLGTNAESLAAARAACSAPTYEFRLARTGCLPDVPAWSEDLGRLSRWLQLDACLQLHDGHRQKALEDVLAGVRLHARWREIWTEPRLQQLADLDGFFHSSWLLLQFPGWGDADLTELQTAWEELDITSNLDEVMALEGAVMEDGLERWTKAQRDEIQARNARAEGIAPPPRLGVVKLVMWAVSDDARLASVLFEEYPCWWAFRVWRHYVARLACLKNAEDARAGVRDGASSGDWWGVSQVTRTQIMERCTALSGLPRGTDLPCGMLPRLLARTAVVEVQRRLLLGAIALERHRRACGEYPGRLEDLSPQFLKAPLLDPSGGRPLGYSRNADGTFTLYSIGENGIDDGGDPRPAGSSTHWLRGLDIVWPRPAPRAAVESAHAKLQPAPGPRSLPSLSPEMAMRFFQRYGIPLPRTISPLPESNAPPAVQDPATNAVTPSPSQR